MVIPVHFGGVPADMDEILALGRARGVPVVVDAAHAFPCSYRRRNVGTLGEIVCFSFYATKTITMGEGGAAVTSSPEWADRKRIMSLHGISRDAWKRYTAEGTWRYDIIAPGFKYNLGDIAAALGLVEFARAEEMRARPSPRVNAWLVSGASILLDVAAGLRSRADTLLLFVGEGTVKDELEREARRRVLRNLRFLPFQPRDRLNEVQATADVSVVTLALQAAIASLLDDPSRREAMGRAARRHFEATYAREAALAAFTTLVEGRDPPAAHAA